MVGLASCITVTVLLEDGQTPFEIVQTKLLVPTFKPVTPLFAAEGLETVDVPVTTDHMPVPVVGTFPDKVAEDTQSV